MCEKKQFCSECATEVCTDDCVRYGSILCRNSLYETAMQLMEEKYYYLAVRLLLRAADKCHRKSCLQLARCYVNGIGVSANFQVAEEYFRLAQVKPEAYRNEIDTAKKTQRLVKMGAVRPQSALEIVEIKKSDLVHNPQYVETSTAMIPVFNWKDVLVHVVSEMSQLLPAELVSYLKNSDLRTVFVEKSQSFTDESPSYEICFSEDLDEVQALETLVRIGKVFNERLCGIKVWTIIKVVPVKVREVVSSALINTKKENSVKSWDNKSKKRKVGNSKKTGRSQEASLKSKPTSYLRNMGSYHQNEKEEYAMKGMGAFARDNGRFGSIPLYDNMND